MTFVLENYNHVIEELKPMLSDHYEEVAMYQDKIPLEPNYDDYKEMQKLKRLYLFTWREGSELVGYNIFLVGSHLHYKSNKFAWNDVVYVRPDYRHKGQTIEFFKFCEDFLKEEAGVSVITYHMKVSKMFKALMDLLEMDHAEHIYTKYIGN